MRVLIVVLVLPVCVLQYEALSGRDVSKTSVQETCAQMDDDMEIVPQLIQTIFTRMDGMGNGNGILENEEFQGFVASLGVLKMCMDNQSSDAAK